MTPATKDIIARLSCAEGVNQMLSRFFILVLAALLCLGTSQSAWAIPENFSQNKPSSPIFIAQQGETTIPPQVVNAVRQDLSRRTNIPPKQLKLKSASRQTWPDGCLGLAAPDEMCTQALIEGWRVEMSYQDKKWVYRTDAQGQTLKIEK